MKAIKKISVCILAVVMLVVNAPLAECYAAGSMEYTSATDMEFNKLYLLKLITTDAYTGEHSYTWYKFMPETSAETKIEIVQTALTGYGVKVHIYDSLLQKIKIRDNKLDVQKNALYYLRMDSWNGSETEISFMLKASGDNNDNSSSGSSGQTPGNGNQSDNNQGSNSGNDSSDNNPGSNSGNDSSDNNPGNHDPDEIDGVDTDFWDENNSGSGVYDDELPVPEITGVENDSRSINITWSCEDSDSIDGYYIYRSKDGSKWNRIVTIKDTEVEDYEDRDITDGDVCGYIICSYVEGNRSENSVPEYTCFLKKVSMKSVKSNASRRLNVKWSTNPGCSGYQIRVSTTKSFTNTTTASINVNSKSQSSETISRLKGGKKYYVQIRVFRTYNGENYYSEWSATKSVKVKR